MASQVIFVVWLIIICLVNVADTFTDTLKHHILQMSAKFVKCIL